MPLSPTLLIPQQNYALLILCALDAPGKPAIRVVKNYPTVRCFPSCTFFLMFGLSRQHISCKVAPQEGRLMDDTSMLLSPPKVNADMKSLGHNRSSCEKLTTCSERRASTMYVP